MSNKKKFNIWPAGIVVVLVIFATFIVSIAAVLSNKNFDLVTNDYYEESVSYNEIISMRKAANDLADLPNISVEPNNGTVKISFPQDYRFSVTQGEVQLLKPDDAKQDIRQELDTKAGETRIKLASMKKGNWKAKLTWEMRGKSYMIEENIQL